MIRNGKLDSFSMKRWEENIKELIIEEDGSVRWKTSGNYLPEDALDELELFDSSVVFSREATKIKRDEQTDAFLTEYRTNPPQISDEMYAEIQSEFGVGTTVVDVITGRRIAL